MLIQNISSQSFNFKSGRINPNEVKEVEDSMAKLILSGYPKAFKEVIVNVEKAEKTIKKSKSIEAVNNTDTTSENQTKIETESK